MKTAVAKNGNGKNRVDELLNGKRIPIPPLKEKCTIPAPNMQVMRLTIRGTGPYVQLRFSEKQLNIMRANQEAGSTSAKGKKRAPKDFKSLFTEAMYEAAPGGWRGIPAPAFRAAMVSACRLVGFKMTLAKLACFVLADGIDRDGTTPLVKITKGKPVHVEHPVRNANGGADIRVRASWPVGWEAVLRVKYDGDIFTPDDIYNLIWRVGAQVGVGEGRPDSPDSCGQGWGTFEVIGDTQVMPA